MPRRSARSSNSSLVLVLALAALPVQAAVGQERLPVPSASQPSRGDRAVSDTAEARQEAVRDAPPPTERAPTADPHALVVTDDDTERGRCRVISKRRLFGGVFMHRKCDDRAPTVGG